MLLLTGISVLGVLLALVVGLLAMLFAGLFVTSVKLLPIADRIGGSWGLRVR